MSLPQDLSDKTLARIVERFGLVEVEGADGGAFVPLAGAMGPVGQCRLFGGGPLQKVVTISLVVPQIGIDSHMIFAFTPAGSVVPHFTLDSVAAPGMYAFHLDLIPRVDLAANLAYMNEVFVPLTPVFDEWSQLAGLSPAHISGRQRALMSPWMLVHRADESAFAQIGGAVDAYLDHWAKVVEAGVAAEVVGIDPAVRDQANRDAIFDPDVDPVWANVARLVGDDTAVALRALLRRQDAR